MGAKIFIKSTGYFALKMLISSSTILVLKKSQIPAHVKEAEERVCSEMATVTVFLL